MKNTKLFTMRSTFRAPLSLKNIGTSPYSMGNIQLTKYSNLNS